MEAWLGVLHLIRQDTETQEEFEGIAAVFCADRQGYEATAKAFTEAQGHQFLWAEEVHPAGQWIARHPRERSATGLARAVHPGHCIEVGTLRAVGKEGEELPEPEYLSITELNDIEPLDDQKGIWPYQTVPDALIEHLFGQPEPTEVEIEKYGSAETVPPMRTYGIVSAEKFQWKFSEIEACELPFRCLFKGEAAEERKDEAPYLIELNKEADFTRRLFSFYPEMPAEMTSVHLWQQEPGMYVRSRAGLDDLWKHFRRFTRFKNEHGRWLHFRFWEGSLFPAYWKHFSSSYERVARFCCSRDFTQSYDLFFIHNGTLTHIKPDVAALKKIGKPVSAFALDEDDHEFFQMQVNARFKNNIQLQLHQKLAIAPDEKKELISGTVDGAFKYIQARNGGAYITKADCFTLSLLVILWGNVAGTILKGPLLNEPLLPIGQRIELAKASYFESIEKTMERGS
ncbi:MAG: DUF4123 domain-containing protein [Vibrio fluvialis]